MPRAIDSIPSRQDVERLFESDDALPAGGAFLSQVRLVAGYSEIDILAVSDQAFSVVVEEACLRTGPFVVTATYASAPAAGLQQVCVPHRPCGIYARTRINNLGGPQASLSFCGTGVPQP